MNNKLTDEQMNLDTAIAHADERADALSGPCAAQHEQLATWLRELQERRKADSAVPIYQYRIRNGYNGQVTEWQTIRRDQVDFVLKAQPLNAGFRIISAPQPAPVVPSEMPDDCGFKDSYIDGWNACRAAMLKAAPKQENI